MLYIYVFKEYRMFEFLWRLVAFRILHVVFIGLSKADRLSNSGNPDLRYARQRRERESHAIIYLLLISLRYLPTRH